MKKNEISIGDAIRLKEQLGHGITWGKSGLNAKELSSLKYMKAEDYGSLAKTYDAGIKNRTFIPVWGLLVSIVLCFIGYASLEGIWQKIVLGIGIWAAYTAAKRDGHREGYFEGYTDGVDSGVDRAFGISEDEAREVAEMAIDMAMDERMMKALDKKSKPGL